MEEITLRELFLILRRYRRLVLGLPLLLIALALLFERLKPPVYEATATVTVRRAVLRSGLEERIEISEAPGFSAEELERVALSKPVLGETAGALAADRPTGEGAGRPDPEELAGRLTLDFAASSPVGGGQAPPDPLVTFAALAPTPEAAAAAANAWAAATLRVVNRLPRERVEGTAAAVGQEVARAQARLSAAEERYREFAASSNLDLDSAALQADVRERARLGALVAAVRQDREVAQAQRAAQGESLARLRREGGGLPDARNPDPEVQRLRGSVSDLGATLARASAELAALERRAGELDVRIASLRAKVGSGSVLSGRVEGELELARNEYTALSQTLSDLKIEAASLRSPAQVLTPAFASTRPANASGALTVALAGVLGLMAGLLLPFLLEAVREPVPARAEPGEKSPPAAKRPLERRGRA